MQTVQCLAKEVRQAALELEHLSRKEKDDALRGVAKALRNHQKDIVDANREDIKKGQQDGMSEGLLDRLLLNGDRIEAMACGVEQIVELDDPVGEVLSEELRPNGLRIQKIRVPLGVLGMIYEARPNVTVDAAGLAIKAGNGVVLRGGSAAIQSNAALVQCMKDALSDSAVPATAIGFVADTSHETAIEMMRLNGLIDVLIPRGSAQLIQEVIKKATIPVIETGVGNCHVYIDQSADAVMAREITVNSKVSRPSVCNAAEKLLVHEKVGQETLADILNALMVAGVELRCDSRIRRLFPEDDRLKKLPEEEYETEYLDLIMGVLMVGSAAEAIRHINRYGSGHTETVVTEDADTARAFLRHVNAAAVGHNVSTRFTDGFEYGLGAEIGISTQKLHARGPMGLKELTSYKYLVLGSGQVR